MAAENAASDPHATTEFHSRTAPAAASQSERIRVALVEDSREAPARDLHSLLLRRLRIYCGILTAVSATVIVINLVRQGVLHGDDALIAMALVATGGSTILLWTRPPATVRGLRGIELLSVGGLAAVLLANETVLYEQIISAAAADGATAREWRWMPFAFFALANSLFFFGAIATYAALIPNTLGRAAVVSGAMAVAPIALFAALGLWLRPVDPETCLLFLPTMAIWLGLGFSLAVFSASRIDVMRREAAAARKLGQYVLREKLGAGGMGEVFRAEHALLRRPCALKTIRPERAGDPRHLERFEREVQATAALTHPNTVQIFDYGRAVDGSFYYVMEYLPGRSLDQLVADEGPVAPRRAVRWLRQLCGALGEAHALGLLHRDIKPGNVMIASRGGVAEVAKLLDFGLAAPVEGMKGDGKLTQEGALNGTPAFMSPEQANGSESLDPRSDLYSLGALAFFLLAGKPPFDGRSTFATVAAHLYELPPALGDLRDDLPPALESAVSRCLAKRPEDRFPDAASLDAALAACQVEWESGREEGSPP